MVDLSALVEKESSSSDAEEDVEKIDDMVIIIITMSLRLYPSVHQYRYM